MYEGTSVIVDSLDMCQSGHNLFLWPQLVPRARMCGTTGVNTNVAEDALRELHASSETDFKKIVGFTQLNLPWLRVKQYYSATHIGYG